MHMYDTRNQITALALYDGLCVACIGGIPPTQVRIVQHRQPRVALKAALSSVKARESFAPQIHARRDCERDCTHVPLESPRAWNEWLAMETDEGQYHAWEEILSAHSVRDASREVRIGVQRQRRNYYRRCGKQS